MDLKEEKGCVARRIGVEYDGIFNLRAFVSSAQSVFYRNSPQKSQSIVTKIFASFALFAVRDISYLTGLLGFAIKKPQINADERRFVDFISLHFTEVCPANSLINSPQSAQRARSVAIFAFWIKKLLQIRGGTRMTRIGRIFTDTINPCASVSSVQSVFYCNPLCRVSAFICVHPRLIFSRKRQEALAV